MFCLHNHVGNCVISVFVCVDCVSLWHTAELFLQCTW